jgi:hypothetical protein
MLFQEVPPQRCDVPGFYLFLNPAYDRMEAVRAFGPFGTPAEALQYHDRERLRDPAGHFTSVRSDDKRIVYRFSEGPLRNMNPLNDDERSGKPGAFGHGVVELREVRSVDWFTTHEHPTMSNLFPTP